MRTNIPSFRLPEEVLNEECDRIINMGVEVQYNKEIKSLKEFLKKILMQFLLELERQKEKISI